MADENKNKIVGLEKEVAELKKHKVKLPARSPGIFKASDGISFANFANNLDNYMRVMRVPEDQRSNVLLTFLSNKDYNNVVRIYDAKKLGSEKYEEAVEKIGYVLNENLSSATALSKMLSLKQGTTPIRDFISNLETLAIIALPEADMKQARERCLISSIQAGCRSKVLAYEIHNFCKSKIPSPSFSEVALKVIELDAILGEDEDEGLNGLNKEFASILQVKEEKSSKLCYECQSDQHFVAQCPQRKKKLQISQSKEDNNKNYDEAQSTSNSVDKQNSNFDNNNNNIEDNFGNQFYNSIPFYPQNVNYRPLYNNRQNFVPNFNRQNNQHFNRPNYNRQNFRTQQLRRPFFNRQKFNGMNFNRRNSYPSYNNQNGGPFFKPKRNYNQINFINKQSRSQNPNKNYSRDYWPNNTPNMRQNYNQKMFSQNKRHNNQRLPTNLMKNNPQTSNINQISCIQSKPADLNCSSLQEDSEQTVLL